ncbi:MAG: hypothetical protein WCB67_08425 [Solirubrobacteraceae bacterium]
MRATRAYVAGFGTAGSVLACAAVLFVIASAVVAFRGWPKIAGQQSPAALRLDASPAPGSGVPGSRVARRLRAVIAAATAQVAPARTRVGARPAPRGRIALSSGSASLQQPSSRVPIPGRTGGSNGGGTSGGGSSGRPTSGGAGGGGSVGGGTPGGGGAGGGVTVSVPTRPPVTVTVPAGPPTTVPVPTAPVGTGVKQVTNSAGNAVSQTGAAVGNLLGG